MSYIKRQFNKYAINEELHTFLTTEGFKEESWHERKCMRYVQSGSLYRVWVMVYGDEIEWYVEYDCGGEVDSGSRFFNEYDFDDFLDIYKSTVDLLARWLD